MFTCECVRTCDKPEMLIPACVLVPGLSREGSHCGLKGPASEEHRDQKVW